MVLANLSHVIYCNCSHLVANYKFPLLQNESQSFDLLNLLE